MSNNSPDPEPLRYPPRPCPTHASPVFKLRQRHGHLSSCPPVSFLFPSQNLTALETSTARLFLPNLPTLVFTGRSGTLKQHNPPPPFSLSPTHITVMDLHPQSRYSTSLSHNRSRREVSVSPTNSSVWSMPVTPIDSPTAYRVQTYDSYPSSLPDARYPLYPTLPAPYACYPKSNVTLPPFSTLLPKDDIPSHPFQRMPSHYIRPPTPGAPVFHQRDFTGSISPSPLRRPPSALSSDLPFAKRRRADPESDQYLARLEGNKAKCMFLLEHDSDAGGETGVCAYEARSDMVRRHIRAVHLKLK